MKYSFQPRNVCSVKIDLDINDGVVSNVRFTGGCNGNLKAISKLVDGMTADEIESKLLGNTCGYNSTSCADQLAKAVRAAAEAEQKGKD
jgi:uncharacterized protein TIGR03905